MLKQLLATIKIKSRVKIWAPDKSFLCYTDNYIKWGKNAFFLLKLWQNRYRFNNDQLFKKNIPIDSTLNSEEFFLLIFKLTL